MDDAISENWLPVPGWEAFYLVSDLGRVMSLRASRCLKPNPGTGGYLVVSLYGASGKSTKRTKTIHKLVAAAFLGPRPDGLVVCHSDGVKTHNAASNLRYDTYSANAFDTVRHGRNPNARKTHCDKGHEFTEANTRIEGNGKRTCRACERAKAPAKYRAEKERDPEAHRARSRERVRAWRRRNPERVREQKRRGRERQKLAQAARDAAGATGLTA